MQPPSTPETRQHYRVELKRRTSDDYYHHCRHHAAAIATSFRRASARYSSQSQTVPPYKSCHEGANQSLWRATTDARSKNNVQIRTPKAKHRPHRRLQSTEQATSSSGSRKRRHRMAWRWWLAFKCCRRLRQTEASTATGDIQGAVRTHAHVPARATGGSIVRPARDYGRHEPDG